MKSISRRQTSDLLARIANRRVLVIGDLMLDHYIWGNAHRISPEAPVPVVEVGRDSYVPGGAANVACNCASLGAQTSVAGVVGDDEAGPKLIALLRAQRITPLTVIARGPTIIKSRVILQQQQLCRLDREAPPEAYAWDAARARRRLRRALAACDAVVFSDYAKGVISGELIAAIGTEAQRLGKLVALDPKPKRPLRFSGIDLLTPNRREAAELAGLEWHPGREFPAEEICRRIHEKHRVRHLVITLSEDGLLLSTEGRLGRQIPTAAREVADTSGAGDTSLAGFVLALVAGAELETAAHFANAAAGVVCGKVGTATVTPDELVAYVAHSS